MGKLRLSSKPKLEELRERHPEWEWAATHNGLGIGYIYLGVRDGHGVIIRPYSACIDPDADLYASDWRVERHLHDPESMPTCLWNGEPIAPRAKQSRSAP